VHDLYAATNVVFADTKYVSDIVKSSLIESYVLPIMTYALGAVGLARHGHRRIELCV